MSAHIPENDAPLLNEKDQRECGWMGCGDRRCEPVCAGVPRDDFDYTTADALARRSRMSPDLWHRPVPGPDYWSWRCLRCSEPVADHPSWWRRLARRCSPEQTSVIPPGEQAAQ